MMHSLVFRTLSCIFSRERDIQLILYTPIKEGKSFLLCKIASRGAFHLSMKTLMGSLGFGFVFIKVRPATCDIL